MATGWLLEYVDAWADRADANGGIIPSNVGLDGTIGGGADGKWYGGAYGWSFTIESQNPPGARMEGRASRKTCWRCTGCRGSRRTAHASRPTPGSTISRATTRAIRKTHCATDSPMCTGACAWRSRIRRHRTRGSVVEPSSSCRRTWAVTVVALSVGPGRHCRNAPRGGRDRQRAAGSSGSHPRHSLSSGSRLTRIQKPIADPEAHRRGVAPDDAQHPARPRLA